MPTTNLLLLSLKNINYPGISSGDIYGPLTVLLSNTCMFCLSGFAKAETEGPFII